MEEAKGFWKLQLSDRTGTVWSRKNGVFGGAIKRFLTARLEETSTGTDSLGADDSVTAWNLTSRGSQSKQHKL